MIKNIPEKIYLVLGFDKDAETNVDFNELQEVSWCTNRQYNSDIEYVLSQSEGEKEAMENQDFLWEVIASNIDNHITSDAIRFLKERFIIQRKQKEEAESCDIACSPSDWYKGGKCDINGCYYETNKPRSNEWDS